MQQSLCCSILQYHFRIIIFDCRCCRSFPHWSLLRYTLPLFFGRSVNGLGIAALKGQEFTSSQTLGGQGVAQMIV